MQRAMSKKAHLECSKRSISQHTTKNNWYLFVLSIGRIENSPGLFTVQYNYRKGNNNNIKQIVIILFLNMFIRKLRCDV